MSCLELHIGKNKYKIYNDSDITGVVSSSDIDLVNDFICLNILPAGYKLEVNDQLVDKVPEVLPETVLIDAIKELQNPETNNDRVATAIDNTNYNWLVNKQVGNQKLKSNDSESLKDNNVLYRENWSSNSSWFGFTKERMFVMTGNKSLSKQSWDFLVNLYNAIKHDDSSAIEFVNNLYNKFASENLNTEWDVFQKLSFLANNYMYELKSRLYSPFNNSIRGEQLNELFSKRLRNKEAAAKLKGKFFKYGNHIFEIIGMGKGDVVEIKSVNAEKEIITTLSIKQIKSLYTPLTVTLGKTDYELVGDTWRTVKNHKNVTKENIIKNLNDTLYECSADGKNVFVFKDTLQSITTETKLQDDSLLLDNLAFGDKIYTPMGKLTKMGNAEHTFYVDEYGNEISINSSLTIYKIESSNNDLTLKLSSFIDLSPTRSYTQDDVKKLVINLAQELGADVNTFMDTVAFIYSKNKKIVQVQNRKVGDSEIYRPKLVISSAFMDSASNLKELYMGIKYWLDWYTNTEELDKSACNNELDKLRDRSIYETKKNMKQEELSQLRVQYLPDSNSNLREKFDDFISNDSQDAVEYDADPLIQKALESGILTMECRTNG